MENDKEKKKVKNFYQNYKERNRDIYKKYTKTLPIPKNIPKALCVSRIKKREDLFLLYKINNIIKERTLLQPNQRILIAVSGGQDSIFLLKILYFLKKKWHWKLGIIHCDHQWNSRSKFQAEHVACLAFNLQINYHEGITIHSVQKESIARIWRYNIIQTIAISNNYSAIITGHNASDRIETLLYNLTRGSGLHGLQSIKWKRYLCFFRVTQSVLSKRKDILRPFRGPTEKILLKGLPVSSLLFKKIKYIKRFDCFSFCRNKKNLYLIRPLLESTRTEIRNVFNIWKFPSWPDLSNKELLIKRNRIRHRLIPYIRLHFNPNIDQTLVRWSEIVQSETFYLEKLTNYILSKIEIKKKIFSNSYAPKNSLLHTFAGGTEGALRSSKKQKQFWEQNFDFYQSAIPIELLRSLPLSLQRRLLKEYIYRNTSRILGFQYIEQIRLSCLLNTYFSTNIPISSVPKGFSSGNFYIAKKYEKFINGTKALCIPEREVLLGSRKEQEKKSKKSFAPWLLFPDGIKLVVRKNYIFLFYPIQS